MKFVNYENYFYIYGMKKKNYVKRKVVIEEINGRYIHQTSAKLDELMEELNQAVADVLNSKDLEIYKSTS